MPGSFTTQTTYGKNKSKLTHETTWFKNGLGELGMQTMRHTICQCEKMPKTALDNDKKGGVCQR